MYNVHVINDNGAVDMTVILLLVSVSQYIHISIYCNTRRIYIVSQYEIRIAIHHDFSFFLLNC